MKLTVLQENLNKSLAIAARTVASRPQLPVLSHVLISTDQGRLKISATDLETGVNLWVGAKIEKDGAISIPAKIFSEFISSLPVGKVDLEVKENLLKLTSGRFEARFNGLAASEFPKIPSVKGKPILVIETELLVKAISQVAFAAANDETRPALTGIYFFVKNSQLNLVATDGYRLSLKVLKPSLKIETESPLNQGLIVPARALQEVSRIAAEAGEEIKFYFTPDAHQLIFLVGEMEIVTRLIEGKFPEFEKIIPSEGKIKASIETDEFTRAIKMAAIFARESANIVRLNLSQKGIEISANTAQIGENKSQVESKVDGGEDKIAFNSRYLLDFLSIVGSDNFQLEISGPLAPGIFRPEKEASYLHVIMPVRVQE